MILFNVLLISTIHSYDLLKESVMILMINRNVDICENPNALKCIYRFVVLYFSKPSYTCEALLLLRKPEL